MPNTTSLDPGSCISIHLWVYCRILLKHCVGVEPSIYRYFDHGVRLGIFGYLLYDVKSLRHSCFDPDLPPGGGFKIPFWWEHMFQVIPFHEKQKRLQREDTINNWKCILNIDKSICHCHIRYWIVADFVSLCKDWWFSNQTSQEHAYIKSPFQDDHMFLKKTWIFPARSMIGWYILSDAKLSRAAGLREDSLCFLRRGRKPFWETIAGRFCVHWKLFGRRVVHFPNQFAPYVWDFLKCSSHIACRQEWKLGMESLGVANNKYILKYRDGQISHVSFGVKIPTWRVIPVSKWLGSPPFTTPVRGLINHGPWLLTTYKSWSSKWRTSCDVDFHQLETPKTRNYQLPKKKRYPPIQEISNRTHFSRTPKKNLSIKNRSISQLTERGPLVFGPIQFLMDPSSPCFPQVSRNTPSRFSPPPLDP